MKKVIEYLPPIFKALEQIQIISNIEDETLETQWKAVNMIIADQWIETATQRGISRREKILNIQPYPDDTLEQRRQRVLALWFSYIPYTYRTLKKILTMLCGEDGYVIELYPDIYTISLEINLDNKVVSADIVNLVLEMIPANLIFVYNANFELKDLDVYVGTDLSAGSHDIIDCEIEI